MDGWTDARHDGLMLMADWMQRCLDQHTSHLSEMLAISFVHGHSNNGLCHAEGRPDLRITVDGVRHSVPEHHIISYAILKSIARRLLIISMII